MRRGLVHGFVFLLEGNWRFTIRDGAQGGWVYVYDVRKRRPRMMIMKFNAIRAISSRICKCALPFFVNGKFSSQTGWNCALALQ